MAAARCAEINWGFWMSFRLSVGLILGALLAGSMPLSGWAEDNAVWRKGVSTVGELRYPDGPPVLPYVNADAPKAGTLRLGADGTFDTVNPIVAKGELASGLGLVYESLLESAEDEISASYGLIAEAVNFPDDVSSATYRIRAEAKWADGTPITAQDIVFSFEKAVELSPQQANYYKHVSGAEAVNEREVKFTFDEKNNRELPQIVGQLLIVPKHWWLANGSDGKPRDITRGTLEPVMGSGPYKIAGISAGTSVNYELRDDYWGKDLNINKGRHNFQRVTYNYYSDMDVAFEAFKAGNVDFRTEQSSSRWMTGYDIPAVKDGRITREKLANIYRSVGIMQGIAMNMRRDKFKDINLRKALNYVFDFEELNRTLAHGQLNRVASFYTGSDMASKGLPEGREKDLLEEVKDQIPAEIFTTEYKNPVGGDAGKQRENLRTAVQLMKAAGYELRNNKMVNAASGQPLDIEVLIDSPGMERTLLPFIQSMKRIGINASLRVVDNSQYTNRVRSFDFDMIVGLWGTGANPGNEQIDFWGSASADRQGSRNYVGIKNPAVDHLISKIVFAGDRDEQLAATRALDRVLLANHYVVPQFHRGEQNLAYWNTIKRPDTLAEYGIDFPAAWWSTKQ